MKRPFTMLSYYTLVILSAVLFAAKEENFTNGTFCFVIFASAAFICLSCGRN